MNDRTNVFFRSYASVLLAIAGASPLGARTVSTAKLDSIAPAYLEGSHLPSGWRPSDLPAGEPSQRSVTELRYDAGPAHSILKLSG